MSQQLFFQVSKLLEFTVVSILPAGFLAFRITNKALKVTLLKKLSTKFAHMEI